MASSAAEWHHLQLKIIYFNEMAARFESVLRELIREIVREELSAQNFSQKEESVVANTPLDGNCEANTTPDTNAYNASMKTCEAALLAKQTSNQLADATALSQILPDKAPMNKILDQLNTIDDDELTLAPQASLPQAKPVESQIPPRPVGPTVPKGEVPAARPAVSSGFAQPAAGFAQPNTFAPPSAPGTRPAVTPRPAAPAPGARPPSVFGKPSAPSSFAAPSAPGAKSAAGWAKPSAPSSFTAPSAPGTRPAGAAGFAAPSAPGTRPAATGGFAQPAAGFAQPNAASALGVSGFAQPAASPNLFTNSKAGNYNFARVPLQQF